jgi:putative transposase
MRVKIRQGYKFRVRGLSDEQHDFLCQQDGQSRWVWNSFLALDLDEWEAGRKRLSFAKQCQILTAVRGSNQYEWLSEGSRPAQAQALRNLQTAWARYFYLLKIQPKLAKKPVYKKKGQHSGINWSGRQHVEIDQANSRLKLPKLGWVRYRNSRHIEGDIINVTVRRCGKHWIVSLGTEREVDAPKRKTFDQRVGVDLGIAVHAALSTGEMLPGVNALRAQQSKLARVQRKLARQQLKSNRRYQTKLKIGQIHRRAANVRKDHLHKLTTTLAKNHGLVCVEDLRVANMSKSAKGTVENPGKGVSAKSGLNRSILDQGWGEMRRQLAYKLGWNGGTLQAVPPQNTSRRCSACQHVDKASRVSQALFRCTQCFGELNADTNAAKNILAIGYAMATAAGSSAENAQGGIGQQAPYELRTCPKTKGIPRL